MAAMVSASKDGGFLASILECFGVQPVRGSSSRRGPQALLELTGWAERGYDLAITPDGPRGPRYVVQEGIIALAQVTGLPIVPASSPSALEDPGQELGPVPDPAAFLTLRDGLRQADPGPARGFGRGAGGAAPAVRTDAEGNFAGLIRHEEHRLF